MNKVELKGELKKAGFPMMMLTRNTRSWLGSKISSVTKGFYNHFCWLKNIDEVASQDMTFRVVPLDSYLTDKYIVKFITDTRWNQGAKVHIIMKINEDLKRPLYRRIYDPLAILGQWTGWKWIQNPMTRICSDYGYYLKDTDPKYNLEYPSPSDLNRYQKEHQAAEDNHNLGYKVVTRWEPDDY